MGGGNSYFQISGQSLVKENYHNSRTSDDIGIKKSWWWHHLGKLWRLCHFSNLWSIQKPNSRHIVLQKLKKSLTQPSYYALSRGTTFAKKYYFFQTNKDISTIMGVLVLKGIFSETTCVCMCVSTYQSSNF